MTTINWMDAHIHSLREEVRASVAKAESGILKIVTRLEGEIRTLLEDIRELRADHKSLLDRFERTQGRFERLDDKFERMDDKIAKLDDKIGKTNEYVADLRVHVEKSMRSQLLVLIALTGSMLTVMAKAFGWI